MANQIHWYELCFYGDEDPSSKNYDPDKACSYVIKTEIPPVISDDIALEILLGTPTGWKKELWANLTCVMEITEDEASFFDVEGLTERISDNLGVYYKRSA